MLGSHPISAVLGAEVSAHSDTANLRAYLKGLTDVGLAVLFCKPGTKEPLDLRTKKQIEDDDAAWQDETGIPNAEHPGGVHLATNDLSRLRSYVTRFRKTFGDGNPDKKTGEVKPIAPVTLAIEVEKSGVIVIDTDTEAQRAACCAWMAELSGNRNMAWCTPTVTTPGVQGPDGVWKHRGGGHFYFATDGIELPAGAGKMTVTHGDEKFDVFWRNRYVLIPPSERKEGRYERIGAVMSLSKHMWLHNAISTHIESVAARVFDGMSGLDDESRETLLDWYNSTSWASILEPAGWELTGTDTSCGCEVWGRPGGRSSDKSATAHNPGCSRYPDSPDPPIHFWSSMPGSDIESKLFDVGNRETLSKLQLKAALEYHGSDADAMRDIDGLIKGGETEVIIRPDLPFGISTGRFVHSTADEVMPNLNAPVTVDTPTPAPAYAESVNVTPQPAQGAQYGGTDAGTETPVSAYGWVNVPEATLNDIDYSKNTSIAAPSSTKSMAETPPVSGTHTGTAPITDARTEDGTNSGTEHVEIRYVAPYEKQELVDEVTHAVISGLAPMLTDIICRLDKLGRG